MVHECSRVGESKGLMINGWGEKRGWMFKGWGKGRMDERWLVEGGPNSLVDCFQTCLVLSGKFNSTITRSVRQLPHNQTRRGSSVGYIHSLW